MSDSQQPDRSQIAAEHLIGNLWFTPDALPLIAGRLAPETMRLIVGGPAAMAYSEMCRLMRSPSETLSAGALEVGLRAQGFDFDWLAKLQSRIAPEGIDVLYRYASEINNAADLFRLRQYCSEADRAAREPEARADTVTADLLAKLSLVNQSAKDVEPVTAVTTRLRDQLADVRAGRTTYGASTGFKTLDKLFRMVNGSLITIAGRPSQGKTSLWKQIFLNRAIALRDAGDNGQVVMFTADDTTDKAILSLACTIAKVDVNRIQGNHATSEEWYCVDEALFILDTLPIMIDGSSHITVESMYYRCAMLNAQKPIRLAGHDYLSLIGGTGKGSKLEEIQAAAEGVKGIGRTLKPGFPWIELAQLTKEVESRADKWPTPSDMQYSGEAESDVAMLIMRPEHYISRGESVKCDLQDREGIALINVGKNKQGNVGMVRMGFDKTHARFYDIETVRTNLEY